MIYSGRIFLYWYLGIGIRVVVYILLSEIGTYKSRVFFLNSGRNFLTNTAEVPPDFTDIRPAVVLHHNTSKWRPKPDLNLPLYINQPVLKTVVLFRPCRAMQTLTKHFKSGASEFLIVCSDKNVQS